MRASRHAALERFGERPLPTSAEEEWRYSRVDSLDLDRYHAWMDDGQPASLAPDLEGLVAGVKPAVLVVVRNGAVTAVTGGDPAVTVGVAGEDADGVGEIAGEPDALTVLNAAACLPLTVSVAASSAPAGTVLISHHTDTDRAATFPRTLIRIGHNAQVRLVEVASSSDVESLTVPVTELEVADGANVSYVHLQQLGERVWQCGLQASRVGRDATFTSAAIALGGDYARLRTDSTLTAPGGTSRLLAAYFGDGARMVDFRTTQDHRGPQASSELLYKGAVAGRSRAVYTGLIHVGKGARGTNAFQTNRNLVLGEGARAESVPNLEIEDNDVRCSHASAVGPVAEDQRFYLEARGIPSDAAERLITLGFLDEVLQRVPVPAVADVARRRLAARLDAAAGRQAQP